MQCRNKIILFSVDKNLASEYFKPYRILLYTFQGLIGIIILVICNNNKDNFLWEPEKINFKFHGIEKTQVKSSCIRFHVVKFEAFEVFFSGFHENLFFRVISSSYYSYSP